MNGRLAVPKVRPRSTGTARMGTARQPSQSLCGGPQLRPSGSKGLLEKPQVARARSLDCGSLPGCAREDRKQLRVGTAAGLHPEPADAPRLIYSPSSGLQRQSSSELRRRPCAGGYAGTTYLSNMVGGYASSSYSSALYSGGMFDIPDMEDALANDNEVIPPQERLVPESPEPGPRDSLLELSYAGLSYKQLAARFGRTPSETLSHLADAYLNQYIGETHCGTVAPHVDIHKVPMVSPAHLRCLQHCDVREESLTETEASTTAAGSEAGVRAPSKDGEWGSLQRRLAPATASSQSSLGLQPSASSSGLPRQLFSSTEELPSTPAAARSTSLTRYADPAAVPALEAHGFDGASTPLTGSRSLGALPSASIVEQVKCAVCGGTGWAGEDDNFSVCEDCSGTGKVDGLHRAVPAAAHGHSRTRFRPGESMSPSSCRRVAAPRVAAPRAPSPRAPPHGSPSLRLQSHRSPSPRGLAPRGPAPRVASPAQSAPKATPQPPGCSMCRSSGAPVAVAELLRVEDLEPVPPGVLGPKMRVGGGHVRIDKAWVGPDGRVYARDRAGSRIYSLRQGRIGESLIGILAKNVVQPGRSSQRQQ